MPFPVRALVAGFASGGFRAAGEVFTISGDDKFGSWMVPVNAADAERLAPKIVALQEKYPRLPGVDYKLPATTAQLRDPPSTKPAAPAAPATPAGAEDL